MRQAWYFGAGGIAIFAILLWALISGNRPSPPAAPETAPAAPVIQQQASISPAPSVPIELILLPDGDIRAVADSVRIGLAYVSPDAGAAAPLGVDEEPEQAGTDSYYDLASVERWEMAPTELLEDGRVKVGPLLLPHADRYSLQARGEDGLRYYAETFSPEAVPDTITPVVGAGIRVHVATEGTRVLLRRLAPSAQAAVWQPLQAWFAPELLEAFSEAPLPIINGEVLAPFSPDPVKITLEVGGVEAESRTLALQAGRIADVRFDPASQLAAASMSMDLELEFVRTQDGTPIQGLGVDWTSGRAAQSETTDARGRVLFARMDRRQIHQFNLQATALVEGLPEWPEHRPLELAPNDLAKSDMSGRVVRHRVELTPLRWLIARVPIEVSSVTPNRSSPYPIHVLQRKQGGGWSDSAAAHFVEVPEGLAVSIAESGTYRVVTAVSPWRVLESTSIHVAESPPQRVEFPGVQGHNVTISLLGNGEALAGASAHISGPLENLPPAVLQADRRGRIVLSGVTASWIHVEVPGGDQLEVSLFGAQAVADFGLYQGERMIRDSAESMGGKVRP